MIVASFYARRPDHPFYQDYTPFLNLLRESCMRHKHRHIVLTDDEAVGRGGDAYVTKLPVSLMRATIAAQLAYLSDPQFADEPTLLTGADCVLASDPLIFASQLGDPDIVITTDDRFQDCRMNCGAIYIPRPAQLAPVWAAALAGMGDEWGDDQTAVYGVLKAAEARGDIRIHELPCDPYNLAPEHPGDDCSLGIVLHFRGPRKMWMVDYCHKWLGLGDGITVTAAPNTEDDVVFRNVGINSRRGLPEVRETAVHDGHAVLVGGGPSLADMLPELRWRVADGQTIFALNGTLDWLNSHGIVADYSVILDCRPGNVDFVGGPVKRRYLLASQCDPTVFASVDAHGYGATVWHFANPGVADHLPSGSDPAIVIGGGLTVGLCAMGLVFAMGYRKMHLYGFDSSLREGEMHAYPQAQSDAEAGLFEVWCDRRPFWTNAAMYAQAEAFPNWANTLASEGAVITVHGGGLLPAVVRNMHSATRLEPELVGA